MCARLRSARMFTEHHVAVSEPLDLSARDALQRDKAEAAEHTLRSEMLGEKFFVAESVLQGQQHCRFVQQWRDNIDNVAARSRFDSDHDQITRADLFRRAIGVDGFQPNIL